MKALSTPIGGVLYSYNSNWKQNHGTYTLDPLGVWVMGSYTAQANSNSIYITGIAKKMKVGQVIGTVFTNGNAQICRIENYDNTTVVIILNDNQSIGTVIQFNMFVPYVSS